MRRWPLLLCALLLPLALASPAGAHAALEDSDPKDESTVSQPPTSVWAEFTEPPMEGSHLEIYDPCGQRVDAGNSEVMGYRVTVGMSGDRSGEYIVEWAVVSATDSHPTTGEFTFTSTGGDPCPSQAKAAPSQNNERVQRNETQGSTTDMSPDVSQSAKADDRTRDRVLGKRVQRSDEREPATGRSRRDVPTAAPDLAQSEPGSTPDTLPLGAVLLGFGLAALIGAGGGTIYRLVLGDPER